jgi:hypothetical protein
VNRRQNVFKARCRRFFAQVSAKSKRKEYTGMKDSQVDLCGELGHEEEDDFPAIERSEVFRFSCNGCGDCCRGREDIVLSGYDLYRIAQRLRLPPRIVAQAFCRRYIGSQSGLPVLRLAPLQKERNNCPFLTGNQCSIHDAEPLVCALYPLGQQIELDGTVHYFVQPIDCGGPCMEARCEDFLARYQIAEREPLDALWAMNCIRLSKKMRQLRTELEPPVLRRVQYKLLCALYYDYDVEQAYRPQFEGNLARFEMEVKKLEHLQARRKTNSNIKISDKKQKNVQ